MENPNPKPGSDHSLALIAAVGQNGEIGNQNELLWHLPKDFKWFKKHTMGCPVVMGRKTFESIGKALPGRPNLVVSQNAQFGDPSVISVFTNLQEAIQEAFKLNPKVFIIGGGTLYSQTLDQAQFLYITVVHGSFPADTFFPKIDPKQWELIFSEQHKADALHAHDFEFQIWVRK